MLVSNILIIFGIWMISAGWELVYHSEGKLVTIGIYKYMRYPQYSSIFFVTLGIMIQRSAITTSILWPFVMGMYYRLVLKKEQEVMKKYP